MKLTGDLKKEAAIEQAGMLLTDDELEKVGGGEIFDASEIDGHDPDNPWEVLNAKGEVVGRAASRNDATSRGEPMEERRIRKYVPVTLRVDENGKIRPLVIEFDEQHKYLVDKVLDVRRAACRSAGGVGDRYTCRIQGRKRTCGWKRGDGSSPGKKSICRTRATQRMPPRTSERLPLNSITGKKTRARPTSDARYSFMFFCLSYYDRSILPCFSSYASIASRIKIRICAFAERPS